MLFSKPKKSHSPFGKWLHFSLLIATIPLLLTTTSCASTRNFSQVDSSAYKGHFSTAHTQLENDKKSLYANTDQVLYALDSGLLNHYSKDYDESNILLSDAEKLIEKYFAISVTQTIGSYLLNDTVVDYPGEDFEDIYTNLFMALNYIQLGNMEAAFVEIRRFNNKLQLLSSKYTDVILDAKAQTAGQGYASSELNQRIQDIETLSFYDSAFARYVSLLLYRSIGRMDSASIDRRYIETAFSTQAQLYPFPLPSAIQEEFSIPQNKERINFLFYSGRAPEKYEEVLRLPGIVDDTWFKLALPIMIQKPSKVSSIKVEVIDAKGNIQTDSLEVLESIENIAIDTFQQRQGLIYLKSLLRAISKTAANHGITTAIQNNSSAPMSVLFNFAANIFTEVSEQADIRSSRYFPALVWVGGLNVSPGEYTVIVTAYNSNKSVVYEEITENFKVQSDNIHLVEAACLQ